MTINNLKTKINARRRDFSCQTTWFFLSHLDIVNWRIDYYENSANFKIKCVLISAIFEAQRRAWKQRRWQKIIFDVHCLRPYATSHRMWKGSKVDMNKNQRMRNLMKFQMKFQKFQIPRVENVDCSLARAGWLAGVDGDNVACHADTKMSLKHSMSNHSSI